MPHLPRPELRNKVYWRWVGHSCLPFRYDLRRAKEARRRRALKPVKIRYKGRGFSPTGHKRRFIRYVMKLLGESQRFNERHNEYRERGASHFLAHLWAAHDVSMILKHEQREFAEVGFPID